MLLMNSNANCCLRNTETTETLFTKTKTIATHRHEYFEGENAKLNSKTKFKISKFTACSLE